MLGAGSLGGEQTSVMNADRGHRCHTGDEFFVVFGERRIARRLREVDGTHQIAVQRHWDAQERAHRHMCVGEAHRRRVRADLVHADNSSFLENQAQQPATLGKMGELRDLLVGEPPVKEALHRSLGGERERGAVARSGDLTGALDDVDQDLVQVEVLRERNRDLDERAQQPRVVALDPHSAPPHERCPMFETSALRPRAFARDEARRAKMGGRR